MDEFRTVFKYFKRRNPRPDLSCVIDFDRSTLPTFVKEHPIHNSEKTCKYCEDLGLRCHVNWKAYTFTNKNGFIFIKNPFTLTGQQRWIRNTLQTYIKKPSITNLDAHYSGLNNIWQLQWCEDREKREYLAKLRWATFGFHYNWDTKEYSFNSVCDFPPCMKSLSKHVAACLGFESFNPEAAIVNFYHIGSTLGRHVDYSEKDQEAPLISFSFGQSAVFLLGSKNVTDKPCSMFIRSGDIILLAGESRLLYHAVPLIISDDFNNRYESDISSKDWEPFSEFMKSSRININIRQVFPSNSDLKLKVESG